MDLKNYWVKWYSAKMLTSSNLYVGPADDPQATARAALKGSAYGEEARVFDRETGELLAVARRRGKGRLWSAIDTYGPAMV